MPDALEPIEPRPWSEITTDLARLGWEAMARKWTEAKTPEEREALLDSLPRYRFTIAERVAKVQELKAAGATVPETAKALGVSPRTVNDDRAKVRDEKQAARSDPGRESAKVREEPKPDPRAAREAALTPEQRETEAFLRAKKEWGRAWSILARDLEQIPAPEDVLPHMKPDEYPLVRSHLTDLRSWIERAEQAMSPGGLRAIEGGKA
jgi:transposase-like protein